MTKVSIYPLVGFVDSFFHQTVPVKVSSQDIGVPREARGLCGKNGHGAASRSALGLPDPHRNQLFN